jgi:hypothetical protein
MNTNINITGAGAASVISSIVAPFYAGIFLDNDVKHRNDVSGACFGKITAPIVPEGPVVIGPDGKKQPPTVHVESKEYGEFIEKLSPETDTSAAAVFSQLRILYSSGYETYDSISGINDKIITEIKDWVNKEEHKGKKLVAIFDFDRTLTVMEGGFFNRNSVADLRDFFAENFLKSFPILKKPLSNLTPATFAEYLAGGGERLAMLQEMFDFLYDNKVSIVLLTNNSACPNARNLFQELTQVYTKGRPVEILCGAEFEYKKGRAVQEAKSLSEMCSKPKQKAGGRRRKIRKTKKQTKQKQKHRKTRRR